MLPILASKTAGFTVLLTGDEAVRAPARGQSAVLYDGDRVIGGGYIV